MNTNVDLNRGVWAAEPVEGRRSAEGNTDQTAASRTQSRKDVPPGLERVRRAAERDPATRFTSLLHHVTPELLKESFYQLKRRAAPGIDGQTWGEYERELATRIPDLHMRLHRGTYRARPARRSWIPKEGGQWRPLGITCLEDKIAQQALRTVLTEIYEASFLGFSYGFRPERGQHDALDAVWVGLTQRKVSWVLDADIQGCFDAIDHDWMMRFLEHRIADRRVLRLVRKWLRVGIIEQGMWHPTEVGSPQGSGLSPLLANIYLHYVLDLWVQKWRRHARGEVRIVRYADDFVMGFQYRDDAEWFRQALFDRFGEFGLTVHPEKTRLLEFGRYAAERRDRRGEGKPETFDFLGFTHICGRTRKGVFTVKRKPIAKRMRRKLAELRKALHRSRHTPVPWQGQWLCRVLRGWLGYYAVPGTSHVIVRFRDELIRHWRWALRRRSQKGGRRCTWRRMQRLAALYLPKARIQHPYPNQRLVVNT